MNSPSTQMNTQCDLGSLVWDTTQLEGEAYALTSFPQLKNANTKKWELTMVLPWTPWCQWMLHNPVPPFLCINNPLLDAFLKYGTIIILKEWNSFSL